MHFHEVEHLSGIIAINESENQKNINGKINDKFYVTKFIKSSSIVYQNNGLSFDVLDESFLLSEKHLNELIPNTINDFIVLESEDPAIQMKVLRPMINYVKKGNSISLIHSWRGPFGCIPPMSLTKSNEIEVVVDSKGTQYLKIQIAFITDKRYGKEREVTLFIKLKEKDKLLQEIEECIKNGKSPEGEIHGSLYLWKAHWEEEIEIDNVKKIRTIINSSKIKVICD